MDQAVDFFAQQLVGIRSGVISPEVVDTVRVDCCGTRLPIAHLAVTAADDRRILVQPHDPQMLGAVEKALQKAGFNAFVFSRTQVVVAFSALSGAQRAQVIAHVGRLAEEAKVAVRNLRKKARHKVAPDQRKETDGELQMITDEAIDRIEALKKARLRLLQGKPGNR